MAIKRYCLPLFEGDTTDKACYWVCDLASEIPTEQLVPGDLVFAADTAKFYKVPAAQTTTEIGAGGGTSGNIPFTNSAGSSANIPLSGGGIQFTINGGGTVTIPLG